MQKILVMNTKGGCGKTTIATNLASLYAVNGCSTVLIDHDPQGSSNAWLQRRPASAPHIHGIAAYQSSGWPATRSWQMRLPQEAERIIIDTPAAIKTLDLANHLKGVNTIVVPVPASIIDIEASTLFLRELLKLPALRSGQMELVVVASRARPRTPALHHMAARFTEMGITVSGHLRDSINYIHCTDLGLGIYDLPAGRAQLERRALRELVGAIDSAFEQRPQGGGASAPAAVPQKAPAHPLLSTLANRCHLLGK